jgi:tetratricopeptide (TPR) repeat protein
METTERVCCRRSITRALLRRSNFRSPLPLFQELGPDARGILGVVAFFPQGVDENNLEWLFPTISNRTDVFDKFCILSLTSRSDGFITMLMPLRDYLSPKDPKTSPLLCATKEHRYFTRMSAVIDPDEPNFGGSMDHIRGRERRAPARCLHDDRRELRRRLGCLRQFHAAPLLAQEATHILKPKIEGLPDDHRSKPECLFHLSQLLFYSVGDRAGSKQLFLHALKLWRERGSEDWVARGLMVLSGINRLMGLPKEGIPQAKEALEIYKRFGNTGLQAVCLIRLGQLFQSDKQFDAAEEAAFRAINLLPEKGEQYRVCEAHRLLGNIYHSKGGIKKAVHHFELAIGIASSSNWHDQLFWTHYKLAGLFRNEGRLDDAQAHVEHAKSHAVDSAYNLGYATVEQAFIWYEQHRFEEARSEILRAVDIYAKLGAAEDVERCQEFAQRIQKD